MQNDLNAVEGKVSVCVRHILLPKTSDFFQISFIFHVQGFLLFVFHLTFYITSFFLNFISF